MGLPRKQNKSLLLHYQLSFPGKKTKKYVHEKRNDGSTNKTKQKSPTSPSTHFPRQEGKKMCMKIEIMDLPQKDKIQIKP